VLGWVLTAAAFGIPSILTLGAPFVALLAFTLTPVSPSAVREPHTRGATA
jgi:hypothetical protein